jgi:glycosyltransferase involved in cell wall biosynthesis
MPLVYRLGDIFILPSKGPGETWGLSVNEAMACGRPVIVSDKCGCAYELIKEGVNGYTFRSGDVNDLVNKMQRMLDRDDLRTMGKNSRNIISNFNYQSFADALNVCFNRIKLEK